MNPSRPTVDPRWLFGDDCDCSARNRLRNKKVRIRLFSSNRHKDRTWFAGTGIVRDVERFDVKLPVRNDCVDVSCEISQFQFVLDALALDASPSEGIFGEVSTGILLTACFESLTRQTVSGETSAPGEGLCNDTTPSPEALSFSP